ncbi:MAG: hypothetical protein ACLRR6_01560 [Oscillospiraceae bacterium]
MIISKYAAIRYGTFAGPATARRNSCQYFGGQISSPQIAQQPYHFSSKKLSSPRQKRVFALGMLPSFEAGMCRCSMLFSSLLKTSDSLQAMQANVWRRFSFGLDLLKMEVSSLAGLILNK